MQQQTSTNCLITTLQDCSFQRGLICYKCNQEGHYAANCTGMITSNWLSADWFPIHNTIHLEEKSRGDRYSRYDRDRDYYDHDYDRSSRKRDRDSDRRSSYHDRYQQDYKDLDYADEDYDGLYISSLKDAIANIFV